MYAVTTSRLRDDELAPFVERACAGDLDAFEEIVRALQGPVRTFARRLMRDADLGDDAAQEAFVRMWRGLRAYTPSGRFVAWSFTVTRNTCVEMLRKEARRPVPVAELPDDTRDPTDAVDVRRAVGEAVGALDEPYRSAFLLRESGLAYEEIADAMRCPIGTVRSRLHEARRRLAERLVGGL